MPVYRLRGAVRQDSGEIGAAQIDDSFEAAGIKEAMLIARDRAFEGHATVNAVWLTDAENNTLWSLRISDASVSSV